MLQPLKDDNGFEYYNELPDNFRPCTDLHQFYQLKPGKKEWKKENVQLIVGLEYLIYSPDTKKYELYKVNHEFFHVKNLIQYMQDGNLFIIYN
jgi:hypothetical protein